MVSLTYSFFNSKINGFDKQGYSAWLKTVLNKYGVKNASLDYVFVDDGYLLEMNRNHLGHDYYTDIITFNYNEENSLCGEMYISVDRVYENSKQYCAGDFEKELSRVMVHGVLHLLGLDDKTQGGEREMRAAEDDCLMLKIVSRET